MARPRPHDSGGGEQGAAGGGLTSAGLAPQSLLFILRHRTGGREARGEETEVLRSEGTRT